MNDCAKDIRLVKSVRFFFDLRVLVHTLDVVGFESSFVDEFELRTEWFVKETSRQIMELTSFCCRGYG